jgi:hypothetical protein
VGDQTEDRDDVKHEDRQRPEWIRREHQQRHDRVEPLFKLPMM